jgi:hypothetical protein
MKKLIFTLSLLYSLIGISQNYLGVTSSNYAGVLGTDLQPASFVDGRFRFDLNLFSMNIGLSQNLGYFDAAAMRDAQGGNGYWWKKSFGDSLIFKSWAKIDSAMLGGFFVNSFDADSDKKLGIYSNIQFDLFNFMFHVNPKVAVGFTAKVRSVTNIDNIDPKLVLLAQVDLERPELWNLKLEEGLFNINHLSWLEYGLNYSQVLYDKEAHFLKVGGKVKYLSGLASAYLYSKNFEYNLLNSDTSVYLAGDFSYGYSNNFDGLTSGDFSSVLKQQSKFGLGLDFGVVYEWRPDWKKYNYSSEGGKNIWARDQNKYKARIGFSILDLGSVKFQKGGLSKDFSVSANYAFDLRRFKTVTSVENFDQIIDTLINDATTNGNLSWKATEKEYGSFSMRTPTVVSLQADYHIWKWFYINATGILDVVSINRASKVKAPNQFSITPSFDLASFGIHVPIYVSSISGLRVGAAMRLGPLTVGFTEINSILATGKAYGSQFYFGLRLPVLYETKKKTP